jgi:hypothetical protein
LILGDAPLVRLAFARILSTLSTPQQRNERFAQLINPVTDPGPLQNLDIARALALSADTLMGDPKMGASVAASIYQSIATDALRRLDWPAARNAAAQMRAAAVRAGVEVDYSVLVGLYDVRFHARTDSVRGYLDHKIPAALKPMWPMLQEHVGSLYGLIGHPAPELATAFHTPPSARAVVRDSITLVAFVDANCGIACYEHYWMLRRIRASAPALRLVLLSQVGGHVRDVTGPVSAQAAQVVRYFADSLHLSPLVFVDTMPWQARAEPDGRRVFGRGSVVASYFPRVVRPESQFFADHLILGSTIDAALRNRITLIGRDGRVAWSGSVGRMDERFLTALIGRMMDGTAP